LLPTILFIIAAYTLYALVLGWCQWQRSRFLDRPSKARSRWLTRAGSALILGLLLWVILWLAPPAPEQNLRLAGILGVTEGEVWLAKKDMAPTVPLQLDQKPPNGQPVYALLHPESPPSLQPPDQPPGGIKLRRPKGKRSAIRESQNQRPEPRLTKKDKARPKKASKPSVRKVKSSEDSTG
jgi:hypothetical protein